MDDPCDDWGSHLIVPWRWKHAFDARPRNHGKSRYNDAVRFYREHDAQPIDDDPALICKAYGHAFGRARLYHRTTLVNPVDIRTASDEPPLFISLPIVEVRRCERCGYHEEKERSI